MYYAHLLVNRCTHFTQVYGMQEWNFRVCVSLALVDTTSLLEQPYQCVLRPALEES